MKNILVTVLILLSTNWAFSQEKVELTNTDGVLISYRLIKTDSSSTKKDKYTLEIISENKNDHDLVYLVGNGDVNTFNYGSYCDVLVANTLNIFGQTLPQVYYYLSGRQSNLKTSDQKFIYLLQKGHRFKNEYKIVTKKGITPVVSANIKERFYQIESLY